jgi:hypothetical protein
MRTQETGVAPEMAHAAPNADGNGAEREAVVVVAPAASTTPQPSSQAADDVTIEAIELQPAETIDSVLSRLTIHDDRPIENLPEMVSTELKMIGRCVNFRMKQTISGLTAPYYYTGLVSMVTDTTVTLMYVTRYTLADFKLYQSRERLIADMINNTDYEAVLQRRRSDMRGDGNAQQVTAASPPVGTGPVESEPLVSKTGEVPESAYASAMQATRPYSFVPQQDPAGSLLPALNLTLQPAEGPILTSFPPTKPDAPRTITPELPHSPRTHLRRPKQFRSCAESLSPLPYVTFLRTSIHEVAFGRDPTNDFYSLFQDPSKQLMDMQYLRMFVRRYLVHACEHSALLNVPLHAFLTVRGACPNLDRELEKQLVLEELPRLVKADRAIVKEKRKQRARQARLATAVEEYQAPRGPFANTGVLYLTEIPQHTMTAGTITLTLTLGFVVFLIVSLTTAHDSLIVAFVAQMLGCFIPSVVVWATMGLLTLLHATSMHLPLHDSRIFLVLRGVFGVGSVVCAVASIAVMMRRMSNESIWNHLYRRRYDSLCSFYEQHKCSGFYYSCGETGDYNPLCTTCRINYPDTECYVDIWGRLQISVMPLLLFSVFILLGSVNGVMLLLRLLLVGRSITSYIA